MEVTNNHFEEVIDQMMIDSFPDQFKEKISHMSTHDKRMAILSLLDKDRNLFLSIKSLIKGSKVSKVDHLKDVILMLRKYVKVGEVEKKKFGEVMTDLDLVKHIISKIPQEAFTDKDTKFLDPANGTGVFPLVIIYKLMEGLADQISDEEERYKWIVENQIYVADIQSKNMFLFMCLADPYDEYELNVFTGDSLGKDFDDHMKNVWGVEKFDYTIGNPPFTQMIDLKFIQKFYHFSDFILFVHPSTWLLDEKGVQKQFLKTKELVKDHLESIELFNGNGIFNIQLFVPCVISLINKSKSIDGIKCNDRINKVELRYDNIWQINKFSNVDEFFSIKSKIEIFSSQNNLDMNKIFNVNTKRNSKSWKIEKYSNLNTKGEFYVNIAQIRGHVNITSGSHGIDLPMLKDDFYTICTRDLKTERQISNHMFFKFPTQNESDNFLKFIRCKFSRFCLSILKNNSQLECGEMSLIPWLDFSQIWTDKKLYEKFNLTSREIDFINRNIPDYYNNSVDAFSIDRASVVFDRIHSVVNQNVEVSCEDVEMSLGEDRYILQSFPFCSSLASGLELFRSSSSKTIEKLNILEVSSFSHPPAAKSISGRCNRSQHPVFYGSLDWGASISELYEGKMPNSGDIIYLSKWKIQSGCYINFYTFIPPSINEFSNSIIKNINKVDTTHPVQLGSNPKSEAPNLSNEYIDFIARKMGECFTMTKKNCYNPYSISSLVAHDVLYNLREEGTGIKIDAILYPSVLSNNSVDLNLAIHPDFIRDNIKIDVVYEVEMRSPDNHIILRKGTPQVDSFGNTTGKLNWTNNI